MRRCSDQLMEGLVKNWWVFIILCYVIHVYFKAFILTNFPTCLNCSSKLQFCWDEKSEDAEVIGRGFVGRWGMEEEVRGKGVPRPGGGDLRGPSGEVMYSRRKASRPARPTEGVSLLWELPPLSEPPEQRTPAFWRSSRSISSLSSRSCKLKKLIS